MNFAPAELTGTRPVTLIHASSPISPLGDIKDELLHRLTQISLGQQLVANVQSKLSDGSFLVKLADTVAKMNLPNSTEVGSKLNLTLIGKEPRPTFVISPSAENITSGINSTPTDISNTAHLISTLLQNSSNQPPAMIIAKSNTVLMNQTSQPQAVAQTLQQAISQSGVFYESHLANWASGHMNVTQLMQEPQAQLSPRLETSSSTDTTNKLTELSNNPTLQQLVNTQLQTLEQNHLIWQGNAWPGQAMQWEISQDTPQHNQQQTSAESTWHSDVKFELPALGNITATLRLTGTHLSVQIQTENPDSANKLQTNTTLLVNALSAAGIPIDAVLIKPAISATQVPVDLSMSQNNE
ncbi:flagellar hook-length control protein FliK [Sulfuriferula nivalis]|uniref:Flagellar hook-length control protein-like C-terminal domain-containing protein n=1 Tax=Sulfuriferula nivalis TaxID=2675298 RepID=A0A809SDU5_9PROT|nr:flagellar hook-length control protein FliK [Sulfuriferula nivalis]BBP00867.1 hypothetical protein SFSGTM_15750 [Sulfuriferula nivalis]